MHLSRIAALAVALAAAGAPAPAAAAGFVPSTGQHARVMGNIDPAQRRNNAVIDRVQSNIRATQRRRF